MRRGLLWLALLGISRAWLRSGLAALVIAAAILAVAFFSGQIELRRADVLAGYDATGAGTLVVGLRGLDESEVDALAASIGHLEKVQSVEAPYSGIGTGVVAAIYTLVPFGNGAVLVLGFPLGFFASGVFSAMGPFFTEHFPTRVRGVGQGFAYNVGRASGALFPTLVGMLSTQMPLGEAIGLFAGTAYATMALAAFLLPETRGKILAP